MALVFSILLHWKYFESYKFSFTSLHLYNQLLPKIKPWKKRNSMNSKSLSDCEKKQMSLCSPLSSSSFCIFSSCLPAYLWEFLIWYLELLEENSLYKFFLSIHTSYSQTRYRKVFQPDSLETQGITWVIPALLQKKEKERERDWWFYTWFNWSHAILFFSVKKNWQLKL
jgi:hypothetical protein